MGRVVKPSRILVALAFLGIFPGCHGSTLPLSSLSGISGEQLGIVLCVIGLVVLTVWLVGVARN